MASHFLVGLSEQQSASCHVHFHRVESVKLPQFQGDRRGFRYIPLNLVGQTAIDVRFRFQAIGEAHCNTSQWSPVGECSNRGERRGHRLASQSGLSAIVNRSQVEEEARYKPIGVLRYARARPTKAHSRRLQTPFCISNNSHQRRRECEPGDYQRYSCYYLQAIT